MKVLGLQNIGLGQFDRVMEGLGNSGRLVGFIQLSWYLSESVVTDCAKNPEGDIVTIYGKHTDRKD